VLFIQISETFTAFADRPAPIDDAAATYCLDVSNSTAFGELAPSTNPPGQQVQFELVLSYDAKQFPLHNRDSYLEHVIKEQEQPVRDPFLWEGSLTIAETLFSGIITYYAAPLSIAGFRLTSEKTLVTGHSCGPNVDDLVLLLEGLRVLN